MEHVTFVLVGPQHGQTITRGGFDFVDGRCTVVDPNETQYNLLTGFYSAWPEDMAEDQHLQWLEQEFGDQLPLALEAAPGEAEAADQLPLALEAAPGEAEAAPAEAEAAPVSKKRK